MDEHVVDGGLGEQGLGEQTLGEQTLGEQTLGEQTLGEHASSEQASGEQTLNRQQIMDLLPHREPMLLVDEVRLEIGADGTQTAIGQYTVRGDEFFLQGHFPGNPIVPGVILCEMMGQSSCILLGDRVAGKTPYFAGMEKVRFRNPVHPGDTITFTTQLLRSKHPFHFVTSAGRVADRLCVTGDLSFALV